MVRQVNKNIGSWLKPLLAIIIAGGGLLWHLMACTESPMAFSPDGRKLAFVTMEPYELDNLQRAGDHAFRLMVLTDQQDLKVIEETDKFLLSAPAFSPDGKSLCYLRVPLLTEETEVQLTEFYKQKQKYLDLLIAAPDKKLPEFEKSTPDQPADTIDLTLPPADMTHKLWKYFITAELLPAVLVVRDAESFAEKSRIIVELPVSDGAETEFLMTYLTAQPQYSPDGQWIYLAAGCTIQAINPDTRQIRFLAAHIAVTDKPVVTVAALAPDSKNVAALLGDNEIILAFFQTDAQRAIYQRLKKSPPSCSGLAWSNNDILALLYAELNQISDDTALVQLDFFRADGSPLNSLKLQLPRLVKNKSSKINIEMDKGELALSADGKYMIIAYTENVYFLTTQGELLKHYRSDKDFLVGPTFTPEGKLVAFKHMTEKNDEQKYPRVLSIDYYTPRGEKVKSTQIPPSKLIPLIMEKKEKEKEKEKEKTAPPAAPES